jgi:uncharacterized protein (TIGR02246 family)
MPNLTAADTTAIMTILDSMIVAWNRHAMDEFTAAMDENVHWVNVVGHYWESRAEVLRAHEWMHRTMFRDVGQRAGRVDLLPLTDDVVIAARTTLMDGYRRPDGGTTPPSEAWLSLVFARKAGGWKIVHGQVTNIDPRATAFDPGKAAAESPGH